MFLDIDGLDRQSWHLLGRDEAGALIAYCRIVDPGLKYDEPSLGRVVTPATQRGTGVDFAYDTRIKAIKVEGAQIDDLRMAMRMTNLDMRLLEKLGAEVMEGAAIVDLPELGGSQKLRDSGLKLFTLVDFAGH